jgi:peptide-methionine (S)-S-oxide reductase
MFLIDMFNKKTSMPAPDAALPGRDQPIPTSDTHFVNGRALQGPYPEGFKTVLLGMGCFWGAERALWKIPGVWVTAAGYSGGITPNPTYHETTTGLTGHTEVVLVVYDPSVVSPRNAVEDLLRGARPDPGHAAGQRHRHDLSFGDLPRRRGRPGRRAPCRDIYQAALTAAGRTDRITTEIAEAGPLYFAEEVHQQYLAKNPGGYCSMRGTGVSCAIG